MHIKSVVYHGRLLHLVSNISDLFHQTVYRSSLICVITVCYRDVLRTSRRQQQTILYAVVKCSQRMISDNMFLRFCFDCQYVPIYASMYQFMPVCTNLCQYVPISASMYQFMPVCTNLCQYVPIYASMYQFMPVCTNLCQYIQAAVKHIDYKNVACDKLHLCNLYKFHCSKYAMCLHWVCQVLSSIFVFFFNLNKLTMALQLLTSVSIT